MDQVHRVFREDRFLSLQARDRYRKALMRFVRWAVQNSEIADLWDLNPDHVRGYVAWMLKRGRKARTIKTDVSALKHVHHYLTLAGLARWRGELPDPAEMGVPPFQPVPDRRWRQEQMEYLLQRCLEAGEERYADMIRLAWELGLRIHEVVRLLRAQCEPHALRAGTLTVVGKGGKRREVPLTPAAMEILAKWRERTPRGGRLFVREGETAGQVIKGLQDFIRDNRPEPDPGYSPLTFHGLRYSYAQREDRRLEAEGTPTGERRREISRRLGHNRPQITKTYVRW